MLMRCNKSASVDDNHVLKPIAMPSRDRFVTFFSSPCTYWTDSDNGMSATDSHPLRTSAGETQSLEDTAKAEATKCKHPKDVSYRISGKEHESIGPSTKCGTEEAQSATRSEPSDPKRKTGTTTRKMAVVSEPSDEKGKRKAETAFGYNIGCVNAPGETITLWIIDSHSQLFNSTLSKEQADTVWSAIVAAFPFGGAVGVAAVLMGGAKPIDFYPLMVIGRFLVGIFAGLSVLCPIYLTEVSPINLRGAIGSVHQLVITIAILVSQILGLPQIFGTTDGWPLIFWFIVVPAFLQIICLKFVPESPRFTLCMRGNIEQATRDLQKLRGSSDVASEIDALNNEAEANKEGSVSKPTMRDMFKDPLKWPMTIALVLMLIQQLSGINAVMFYSTVIFKTAGLTDEAAVYATIAMGTVNVLMTIVSVWLVDHPRAGRRSLLLMSLSGMWITTILLTICISLSMGGAQWASYGAITSVLLYVVSFASGTGSIPWFFVSEIFHSNSRANANSIAITTNWSANIVVSMAFLPLNNAIKQYSILVFTNRRRDHRRTNEAIKHYGFGDDRSAVCRR
ncbi:hypothetical protein Q1695_011743 [Nippostrongylus brasiliensis]|nr:hypothetical protein Q1695_011743 [Nippostrongylus brasiliensis]